MSKQSWTSVSRVVRITVQSNAHLDSLSTFIKRLFILFSLGDARRMVLVVGIGKRRRTVYEASQQGLISNDLTNNSCVREERSPRQVKVPQHLFLCLSRAGFLTVSAQLSHLHQGGRTMVSEADNDHSADLDDNSLEGYHSVLVDV